MNEEGHNNANKQTNNKINVVLAADNKYSEQVITTIKSICYHNQSVHFYLLNKDFSPEWFDIINRYLEPMDCYISDITIHNNDITHFKTYPHINSDTTYYRYFIPEIISDNKCLYLDCDLVVNGPLQSLYQLDLQDNFVAAVKDPIALEIYNNNVFNAGVLLINNELWRQEKITEKALYYTKTYNEQLRDGDQQILNILFEQRWLKLNRAYNYQIGVDYMFTQSHRQHKLEDLADKIPLIIHYSTTAKPWKPYFKTRFRELYWFYYKLTWQEIISRWNK